MESFPIVLELARAERPPFFPAAMFFREYGLDLEGAAELMSRALEQQLDITDFCTASR